MVRMKERVVGSVAINDSMKSGRNENSERVLGLASAWQHSRR